MLLLMLLCTIGAAIGQNTVLNNMLCMGVQDHIHGYTFEYHPNKDPSLDFILVRNATACYIVEGDTTLPSQMKQRETKEALVDNLYAQIKANAGVTPTTTHELTSHYHDIISVFECINHGVYILHYSGNA